MKKYQTLFTKKHWLLFVLIIISLSSAAQKITTQFAAESFTSQQFATLKGTFGKHKTIPLLYEKQILIALSFFPELQHTKIIFRIRHTHTPLSSRPTVLSVLRNSKRRTYLVTFSDTTNTALAPILLKNLPFNAQVGVIGHELSHAVDFSSKNTFGLLRIALGNLSRNFLDGFEYKTDSICIAHGLGYQLLSWSTHVRKSLMNEKWDGADSIHQMTTTDRYMNPGTIRQRIAASPAYSE